MRSEGFWFLARLSEGAWPRAPVTELKRRQKLKIQLPHGAAGARYRIDRNALVPRPFVFVAGGRFVKAGCAGKALDAIPVHFDVADVPVHKAHHVAGVRELQRLQAVVAAQTEAAGNLPDKFGLGRLVYGRKRLLRHARIVGLGVARYAAVEPVAGKTRPGLIAIAPAAGRVKKPRAKRTGQIEIIGGANKNGVAGRRVPGLAQIRQNVILVVEVDFVGVVGDGIAVVVRIHMHGQIDLTDIADARDFFGGRFGPA